MYWVGWQDLKEKAEKAHLSWVTVTVGQCNAVRARVCALDDKTTQFPPNLCMRALLSCLQSVRALLLSVTLQIGIWAKIPAWTRRERRRKEVNVRLKEGLTTSCFLPDPACLLDKKSHLESEWFMLIAPTIEIERVTIPCTELPFTELEHFN